MKKFAKLAFAAAAVAMAASAYAQSVPYEKKAVNDNWGNGTSEWVWKNGTNELCWRNGFWTPATANAQCDGALAPAAAPTAATPAAPAAVAPTSEKVTFAADTLFDFDKAVLKPEGKGKRQLKVDPKSCKGARKAQIACQQPNRRVDVEVVGTKK